METVIRKPTLLSRLVKWVLLALYRWKGWTLVSVAPVPRRCVILGVPHTSNWDFVFFLGATHEVGIAPNYMGKLSLFKWPMTRFMFDMGGISVDRSAKGMNYVDQIAAEFERREDLPLVIAPEGTRGAILGWRSGFYNIALKAGVPIVPAWVDNAKMIGGIGEAIMPSGDYAADLAKLLAYYRSAIPGHPRWDALEATITGALEKNDG
ncbi:MAG: acyltransferase [Novosphingobium sp.]|nr:acyltransferase [Novosphingobium sp.]MBX9645026.1 1-acyl-sn-glycerol-3-phosphate acyltransferase [Novosphingobium sp.]